MCWLLRRSWHRILSWPLSWVWVNYIPHQGKYVAVELREDPHPAAPPPPPALLLHRVPLPQKFSVRLQTIHPQSVCRPFTDSCSESCVRYFLSTVFPHLLHSYVHNFAHFLFPQFPWKPSTFMLLYQPHASTYPVLFFVFFTRSYAIFCYAWRIHLACGRSGSDGYISLGGGSWLSGEWLASPVHSGLCACWGRLFHWSEPVDFGVPTGVLELWLWHPAGCWRRAPHMLSRCYPARQFPVFTTTAQHSHLLKGGNIEKPN